MVTRRGTRKRSVIEYGSDDESPVESSSEEESIIVEQPKQKRKKTQRKNRAINYFVHDEVEVDDDETESMIDNNEAEVMSASERREVERMLHEQQRQAQLPAARRNRFANMNEQQFEAYFQRYYGDEGAQLNDEEEDEEEYGAEEAEEEAFVEERSRASSRARVVPLPIHHGELPTNDDPNLWVIKVKQGEEKTTLLKLLRKCIAQKNAGNPLGICSIVYRPELRGMLYVESKKRGNVQRLIDGIPVINPYHIVMVPLNDMPNTLRVAKKSYQNLKEGDFVRLKRTMYKGDLAQVDWINIEENQINLRLLPRIDYEKKRGVLKHAPEVYYSDDDEQQQQERDEELEKFKEVQVRRQRRRVCPRPALFDVKRIKELGADVKNDGDFLICEGQRYRNGFLYKSFKLNAVTNVDIKPTYDELKVFRKPATKNEPMPVRRPRQRLSSQSVRAKVDANNFVIGDGLEVVDGKMVKLSDEFKQYFKRPQHKPFSNSAKLD